MVNKSKDFDDSLIFFLLKTRPLTPFSSLVVSFFFFLVSRGAVSERQCYVKLEKKWKQREEVKNGKVFMRLDDVVYCIDLQLHERKRIKSKLKRFANLRLPLFSLLLFLLVLIDWRTNLFIHFSFYVQSLYWSLD